MDGNAAMSAEQAAVSQDADDRYARVVLSIITDPGDEVLAALLRKVPASEIAAVVMSRHDDPASLLLAPRADDFFDEPGPGELGACAPGDDAATGEVAPGDGAGVDKRRTVGKLAATRAIERWRKRRATVPPPGRLAIWEEAGYRVVCPGEA